MHPRTSARCIFHNCSSINNNKREEKNRAIFYAFGDCGYTNYDEFYIDHGNIVISYLDIDIKGSVYKNSSTKTPVNSVRVVTCVDNTPVVTARGKREEATKGDTVTVLGARPIHRRHS
jgi:hypothetical protein